MSGPHYSYATGTISIERGATTLNGVGTAWVAQARTGDPVYAKVPDGGSPEGFDWKLVGFISEITDNLTLELFDVYEGDTLDGVSYRISRGSAWYAGAAVNETLVTFLTELGVLGLAGASSAVGAPLSDEGRENQLHIDGNLVTYQKRGGTWYALTSPAQFHAVGERAASPSDRDLFDDGQGDLAEYVGRGLTFFDISTGTYDVLVSPSDGGSPPSEAVWAGPFDWRGATGADGRAILNGSGPPSGGTGENGDFYIDTATTTLYGPKAAGVWPAGIVLPGDDGEDGDDGSDGANAYTYVRYASDSIGTNFSATPASGLDYIAILSTDTAIPSPAAGDFAGLWFKYKGDTGAGLALTMLSPEDYSALQSASPSEIDEGKLYFTADGVDETTMVNIVTLTEAQYDALAAKNPTTIYAFTE